MTERLPGIRPRPSLARLLDMTARRAFPASMTALLLLVLAAPFGVPGQAELQQAAALSCVFFWSLHRPVSMPPVVVFCLGLLLDLLSFAPVGVGVLSLLTAHGVAIGWRRVLVRQGFAVIWLCVVGLAAAAAALGWAMTSLLTFRLLPPWPTAFQAAVASGLYPAFALLLGRANRTLAEPEQA